MFRLENTTMTSLQGYVDTSYNRLVDVFGAPHWRGGDKTTVEWAFFHDGERITIYDYKWESCQNDTVEHFHIGGDSRKAVEIVKSFLEKNCEGCGRPVPVMDEYRGLCSFSCYCSWSGIP